MKCFIPHAIRVEGHECDDWTTSLSPIFMDLTRPLFKIASGSMTPLGGASAEAYRLRQLQATVLKN